MKMPVSNKCMQNKKIRRTNIKEHINFGPIRAIFFFVKWHLLHWYVIQACQLFRQTIHKPCKLPKRKNKDSLMPRAKCAKSIHRTLTRLHDQLQIFLAFNDYCNIQIFFSSRFFSFHYFFCLLQLLISCTICNLIKKKKNMQISKWKQISGEQTVGFFGQFDCIHLERTAKKGNRQQHIHTPAHIQRSMNQKIL